MVDQRLRLIHAGLADGRIVPYLGPGVLALTQEAVRVPASAEELVSRLTARTSVPHKIRNNLSAVAQFIENFKHRKTVSAAMTAAFSLTTAPTALHRYLAGLPALPLWVHAWYDDLPQRALRAQGGSWGMVQGVSQAEHAGGWVRYFEADGCRREDPDAPQGELPWTTLLYQPLGSVAPAGNFLVSDSDYVEVLTEIDIQTPIPNGVQQRRTGRSFLFMGCRFATQLERIFAQQIIKRSSELHWAILPEEPTRNERRFLDTYHIQRIDLPLNQCVAALAAMGERTPLPRLAASRGDRMRGLERGLRDG